MPAEPFERFIGLFAAGLGLLLAGGVNCLFPSVRLVFRLLFCLVAMGCALAVLSLLTPDRKLLAWAGGLMAVGVAVCLLAGSGWLAAVGTALLHFTRRPRVRWGALGVAGVAITLGSVISYEAADKDALDQELRELEELASSTKTREVILVRAVTDKGTPVILKEPTDPRSHSEMVGIEERYLQNPQVRHNVIRQGEPSDKCNCHGWVFTGGRYWVTGNQVDLILHENGYQPVTTPRPGDLVVYRRESEVLHTAIVRYVTAGLPVMVEGKWGCTGIYLHPVEQSCYGKNFTYYQSRRAGHLLIGMDTPSPPGEAQAE